MAMSADGKLMDMLTGYAASHQHPFNVFVHMIGIPMIMLGVLLPLTWASVSISGFAINLAQVLVVAVFLFYLTLDALFAVVYLVGALLLAVLAAKLGASPGNTGWYIAAAAFFGGYAAQFVGHAVEKSMPVLVKHPVQANLAAPFFTVVELFHLAGLRDELFQQVRQEIDARRRAELT
jgi:uncharacterized membrane protein YGL010W